MITMPFGKHRGVPIDELESSYLGWLLANIENLKPYLETAIRAELQSRFGSSRASDPRPPSSPGNKPCPNPSLAATVITVGFKTLARRVHPDCGGSTADMQQLNAVADWLKRMVPQ